MWFITDVNPALRVRVPGGSDVVFKSGSYRTNDPNEINALRQDCRVKEALEKKPVVKQEVVVGYIVDTEQLLIHDLVRSNKRCDLPNDLRTAVESGRLKVYRRKADAIRWNKDATLCPYCMDEKHGHAV